MFSRGLTGHLCPLPVLCYDDFLMNPHSHNSFCEYPQLFSFLLTFLRKAGRISSVAFLGSRGVHSFFNVACPSLFPDKRDCGKWLDSDFFFFFSSCPSRSPTDPRFAPHLIDHFRGADVVRFFPPSHDYPRILPNYSPSPSPHSWTASHPGVPPPPPVPKPDRSF